MGKFRTKSSITKRFKVSKNGKVLHKSLGDAKLHAHKPTSMKRRYGKTVEITSKKLASKIKRALGA